MPNQRPEAGIFQRDLSHLLGGERRQRREEEEEEEEVVESIGGDWVTGGSGWDSSLAPWMKERRI